MLMLKLPVDSMRNFAEAHLVKPNFSVVAVLAIALWLPIFLAITSLQGCQAGSSGLLRPIAPSVEYSITNVIPMATSAATAVLPAPFSGAVQATAAAVLALLAAWQGFTHERMKKQQAAISLLSNRPPT